MQTDAGHRSPKILPHKVAQRYESVRDTVEFLCGAEVHVETSAIRREEVRYQNVGPFYA